MQFDTNGSRTDTRGRTATTESATGTTSRSTAGSTAETTEDRASKTASLESPVTVDGRSVTVWSGRATRFLRTLQAGAHQTVTAARDRQYVVVELGVAGADAWDAAVRNCELHVDGDHVEPLAAAVEPFTDRTHLGFSLPVDVEPAETALVWRGSETTVTWSLPDAVSEKLAAPPAYDVDSFVVEASAGDCPVEASVSVSNVGDSAGVFVASLGTTSLSDQPEITIPLDAGGSTTRTECIPYTESEGGATIVLDWGWDALERTVDTAA